MLRWAGSALERGVDSGQAGDVAGATRRRRLRLLYRAPRAQATLCFWTVESLEIMNALTYGGTEAAQYPLTLYRDWFRRFFMPFVVPLAFVASHPCGGAARSPHGAGRCPQAARWASPLVGVAFLLSAAIVALGSGESITGERVLRCGPSATLGSAAGGFGPKRRRLAGRPLCYAQQRGGRKPL